MNTIRILLPLLGGAIFWWLLVRMARKTARHTAAGKVVEFGWFGWGSVVLALALLTAMVWDVLSGDSKATITDWRVPAAFSVICSWFLIEVSFRRIVFSDTSVSMCSPWSGTKRLAWTEIISVRRVWWRSDGVRVETTHGSFFLYYCMSGKDEFLAVLAEKSGVCKPKD